MKLVPRSNSLSHMLLVLKSMEKFLLPSWGQASEHIHCAMIGSGIAQHTPPSSTVTQAW